MLERSGASFEGAGGPSPPQGKRSRKKRKKMKKRRKKKEKKKGTMNIKCCFFQFFGGIEKFKKIWPPQEKIEMTPLQAWCYREPVVILDELIVLLVWRFV